MPTKLNFEPVSSSWLALHPEPKGVIQFIGGTFFGLLPTVSYRYLLRELFAAGYTVIALPFRVTFNHWSVALNLLEEQYALRDELVKRAKKAGYPYELYQKSSSYFWIGHSLGCKYIGLLELLSDDSWREEVEACINEATRQEIEALLVEKDVILNQPSLLIAPDISDTETSVPRILARFLEAFGLGVKPTRQQTFCLIERSKLFNLTAIISFKDDTVAGSKQKESRGKNDVRRLLEELEGKNLIHQEIAGKHLEPVGVQVDDYIVDLNPLDKFIKPLSQRELEGVAIRFLEQLQSRLKTLA
jgi:hypothetical protein